MQFAFWTDKCLDYYWTKKNVIKHRTNEDITSSSSCLHRWNWEIPIFSLIKYLPYLFMGNGSKQCTKGDTFGANFETYHFRRKNAYSIWFDVICKLSESVVYTNFQNRYQIDFVFCKKKHKPSLWLVWFLNPLWIFRQNVQNKINSFYQIQYWRHTLIKISNDLNHFEQFRSTKSSIHFWSHRFHGLLSWFEVKN